MTTLFVIVRNVLIAENSDTSRASGNDYDPAVHRMRRVTRNAISHLSCSWR